MAKIDTFQGLQRVRGAVLLKTSATVHFKKSITAAESVLPANRTLRSFKAPKVLICEIKDDQILKQAAPFSGLMRQLKRDRVRCQVIPGYSKTGRPTDPMVFPNGVICILLKKPLTVAEKKQLISTKQLKIIKLYGRSPFLKIRVPVGRETEVDSIVAALEKKSVIEAVTPDFDYYGEYKPTPMMPPSVIPDVGDNTFFQRSFVERAWQLGWGKAGIDVDVLDSN